MLLHELNFVRLSALNGQMLDSKKRDFVSNSKPEIYKILLNSFVDFLSFVDFKRNLQNSIRLDITGFSGGLSFVDQILVITENFFTRFTYPPLSLKIHGWVDFPIWEQIILTLRYNM